LRKTREISLFIAALAAALCALCFAANTVLGQETREEKGQEPAQGELKLEGRYIKQLTLERGDRKRVNFDQPGESIKVAAGEYRLWEVQLEGGYTYQEWMVQRPERKQNRIEVGEDKPAVLKVGAPLKQIVKVERQGRVLAFDYKLSGIGGEPYVRDDRSNPPTFTVYKGDKRIASGTFEYG
jgi:hypothetical protein